MTKEYVVDASVVIKWLSQHNEEDVDMAEKILQSASKGDIFLFAPDTVVSEVGNVLVRGKGLKTRQLQETLEVFWQLPLLIMATDDKMMETASTIAAADQITFYDANYLALSFLRHMPLITSNLKHQRSSEEVRVIPLGAWIFNAPSP